MASELWPYETDYVYAGGGEHCKPETRGYFSIERRDNKIILSIYPEDDYYSGDADITALVTSLFEEKATEKG